MDKRHDVGAIDDTVGHQSVSTIASGIRQPIDQCIADAEAVT